LTETSGNDSTEDDNSIACIEEKFLADDDSSDDPDSEEVKISVKRQHKLLRRKRRKLDRAKEKAWQAQEKRRHKRKEKLIKVFEIMILFNIYFQSRMIRLDIKEQFTSKSKSCPITRQRNVCIFSI